MAIVKWEGKGEFEELVQGIIGAVNTDAVSVDLVCAERTVVGTVKSALLVFEKHYMRNDSSISIAVQVIAESGNIKIITANAGGGRGAFFNFSWDKEDSFTQIIASYLDSKDFVRI